MAIDEYHSQATTQPIMSKFYISANFAGQPPEGLVQLLSQTLQSIEDEHNAGPDLISIIGQQKVPVGLVDGDVVASLQDNKASMSFVSNGRLIPLSGYLGQTQSESPPTISDYPNEGDWGFHYDPTAGPGNQLHLARNLNGVIHAVTLT